MKTAAMSSFHAIVVVLKALRELDVPYMLVGAFSSNAYSFPRATNDADIVVEYRAGMFDSPLVRLGGEYRLESQATFAAITGTLRNTMVYLVATFDRRWCLWFSPSLMIHARSYSRQRVVNVI